MKPACVIPIGVMAMALAVSASAQNAGSSSVARALSGPRVTGVTIADAAMKRDLAAVRALLRQKADVNATQADGATALHWAAYYNAPELADVLLAAGASPTKANRDGATPLQLACISGSASMIERLLKAGADANERGLNGETPLMMAARTGSVPAMTILIEHRADVNARETLRGTTALMWATAQAHPDAVHLLVERGADVAARSNPAPLGRTAYLAPTARQRGAEVQADAAAAVQTRGSRGEGAGQREVAQGGGLTALVFAAREGDLASAEVLLAAGADIDQQTQYGWTALLTATQNRNYVLASYLLEHGANPNIGNRGGWTPLYLATDNRNIEGGDYPVRAGDMDHLDFIQKLLAAGADVNARAKDSTETRTIFTMQWLYEDGATPFLRASQSGDVELMKLLFEHGADPKIATVNNTTALAVASGIGWVEGVTYEHSAKDSVEAVKLLLDLGVDPNIDDGDGRTALHGAAHKGRNDVVQLLVDHGAKLDARDLGSRDTGIGALQGHGWLPVDYADGLVRVGVQSAIPHPETAALIRKLMKERDLAIPPPISGSVCITQICK
jgi:ankyrin repeat protein